MISAISEIAPTATAKIHVFILYPMLSPIIRSPRTPAKIPAKNSSRGSSTCVLDTRSSASKISSIVFESILYLLSVYFSGKKPICYCTVEHFQRFALCRVHEHRVLTEFFVHFNDHPGHLLLYYAPDEGKNPFPVAGNGDVGYFRPASIGKYRVVEFHDNWFVPCGTIRMVVRIHSAAIIIPLDIYPFRDNLPRLSRQRIVCPEPCYRENLPPWIAFRAV